ncbi:hypothetical protein [Clostridium gasigenes]|nr:hypothetical protein [Clostridium gasigenes]
MLKIKKMCVENFNRVCWKLKGGVLKTLRGCVERFKDNNTT